MLKFRRPEMRCVFKKRKSKSRQTSKNTHLTRPPCFIHLVCLPFSADVSPFNIFFNFNWVLWRPLRLSVMSYTRIKVIIIVTYIYLAIFKSHFELFLPLPWYISLACLFRVLKPCSLNCDCSQVCPRVTTCPLQCQLPKVGVLSLACFLQFTS